MSISTLLMILALATGPLTGPSISSGTRPPLKPESNCWINGVLYNPCPEDVPLPDKPPPINPPL